MNCPSVGRFVTEDSYPGSQSDPMSLNRYVYARDNPESVADLTGHWGFSLSSLVSALSNTASKVVSSISSGASAIASAVSAIPSTVQTSVLSMVNSVQKTIVQVSHAQSAFISLHGTHSNKYDNTGITRNFLRLERPDRLRWSGLRPRSAGSRHRSRDPPRRHRLSQLASGCNQTRGEEARMRCLKAKQPAVSSLKAP